MTATLSPSDDEAWGRFVAAARAAAILFALILFDERLNATQWFGVALVAAGLFFMEAKLKSRWVAPKATE